ncbi:hypothetical protein [Sphingomonas sp. DT-204]|uniref:hypothetical protein n=1 Tax=Sphingomonas sp. DT-204 TaxID=3396166 RepID=UPI003F1CCEEA
MYQFFCKVADTPCPLNQQASINDVVFAVNPENITLAFACGFMLVMLPGMIAFAASTLLGMIDGHRR